MQTGLVRMRLFARLRTPPELNLVFCSGVGFDADATPPERIFRMRLKGALRRIGKGAFLLRKPPNVTFEIGARRTREGQTAQSNRKNLHGNLQGLIATYFLPSIIVHLL